MTFTWTFTVSGYASIGLSEVNPNLTKLFVCVADIMACIVPKDAEFMKIMMDKRKKVGMMVLHLLREHNKAHMQDQLQRLHRPGWWLD